MYKKPQTYRRALSTRHNTHFTLSRIYDLRSYIRGRIISLTKSTCFRHTSGCQSTWHFPRSTLTRDCINISKASQETLACNNVIYRWEFDLAKKREEKLSVIDTNVIEYIGLAIHAIYIELFVANLGVLKEKSWNIKHLVRKVIII